MGVLRIFHLIHCILFSVAFGNGCSSSRQRTVHRVGIVRCRLTHSLAAANVTQCRLLKVK